jgi:Ca2+-binding RTX toxin-like protein
MKIFYGGDYLTSGSNMAVQVIKVAEGEMLTANAAKTAANPTGADRLIGNVGNDTLVGDGGRDVLIGGAGDDLIKVAFESPIAGDSVADAADGVRDSSVFFKIDGGTGVDTLEFTTAMGTANTPFSLSALPKGTIENIEVLRLGQGNQSISLDQFDVLAMTGSTNTAIDDETYQKGNTLVIHSTSDDDAEEGERDHVTLVGDDWAKRDPVVSVGGQGSFSVYQHGSSNIHVVIDDNITHGLAT